MMHHRKKERGDSLRFAGQLLAWALIIGLVLAFVAGCKTEDKAPGPKDKPGPTFVREPLHSMCGRCFDRPGLGHPSEG